MAAATLFMRAAQALDVEEMEGFFVKAKAAESSFRAGTTAGTVNVAKTKSKKKRGRSKKSNKGDLESTSPYLDAVWEQRQHWALSLLPELVEHMGRATTQTMECKSRAVCHHSDDCHCLLCHSACVACCQVVGRCW